jgi:hypothetical protein
VAVKARNTVTLAFLTYADVVNSIEVVSHAAIFIVTFKAYRNRIDVIILNNVIRKRTCD